MLCFKAFLLSLLFVVLLISPAVSARQLTPTTTNQDVKNTAEKPNKLDGYDDQGGYEYGNSGYYGHEGYGGYEHKGYGHEGYDHEGYGHEGYGGYGHEGYRHEGYGHVGFGHEGYGGYGHDGYGNEGYRGGYLASKENRVGVAYSLPGMSSRPGFGHRGYGPRYEPKANVEETKN